MRTRAECDDVAALLAQGWNDCQISRATGIPVGTVRNWRVRWTHASATSRYDDPDCPLHGGVWPAGSSYAYLLGLYLGDGNLVRIRTFYRLEVTLDARYPGIVDACADAIAAMRPSRPRQASRRHRPGCIVLERSWIHWACLFPQHGAGPKHLRPIRLEAWQSEIVRHDPGALLRGLIHSDGCRVMNRVRRNLRDGLKPYAYPRYMFTNVSEEIRRIFCEACELSGVRWRQMRWNAISVAGRRDVAILDRLVGPKG